MNKDEVEKAISESRAGLSRRIFLLNEKATTKQRVVVAPVEVDFESTESKDPSWCEFQAESIAEFYVVGHAKTRKGIYPVVMIRSADSRAFSTLAKRVPSVFVGTGQAAPLDQAERSTWIAPQNWNPPLPLISSDDDVIITEISAWCASDGRYRCELAGRYESVWNDEYKFTIEFLVDNSSVYSDTKTASWAGYQSIRLTIGEGKISEELKHWTSRVNGARVTLVD